MTEQVALFATIPFLFVLFLILKHLTNIRFCVLCVSVFISWLTLLAMYWLNLINDPLIIAPLVGASATGIYYLTEKNTPERFHVFRLPFFLSLIFSSYLLLGVTTGYIKILFILLVLWALFGIMYAYREHPTVGIAVRRIIACCRDW